jgi:hypothetical protein
VQNFFAFRSERFFNLFRRARRLHESAVDQYDHYRIRLKILKLVLNFRNLEERILQKLSPKSAKTFQKGPVKSKKVRQNLFPKLEIMIVQFSKVREGSLLQASVEPRTMRFQNLNLCCFCCEIFISSISEITLFQQTECARKIPFQCTCKHLVFQMKTPSTTFLKTLIFEVQESQKKIRYHG